MDNFYKNIKYYCLGEFMACIMLKGVIHPDMQEDNIGCRGGRYVLTDFADIATFDFPEGLDIKVVNRLTDALFPPSEKILKNFELMSSFRAGFISVGGLIGRAIFDSIANNGISSFSYIGIDLKREGSDSSYLFIPTNKKILKEWQNAILNELGYEEIGNIVLKSMPMLMDNISDVNSYYLNQLLVLKAYSEGCDAEDNMGFWITALHFACESIRRGYLYTGYGVFKKILHMCKHAYLQIVMYHAKIEELLEGKELLEDLKQLIEDSMGYNFFQMLWLLNDIDYIMVSNK